MTHPDYGFAFTVGSIGGPSMGSCVSQEFRSPSVFRMPSEACDVYTPNGKADLSLWFRDVSVDHWFPVGYALLLGSTRATFTGVPANAILRLEISATSCISFLGVAFR